jgi:hypothetical protein
MTVMEAITPILVPVWTAVCLLVGVVIGWRVRGGQAPIGTPPNPFRKKPELPPKPVQPKPQVMA